MMAHRDDTERVLVACESCESAYAARRWPDGEIRLIGAGSCSCGSTEFEVVEETDVLSDEERSDRPAGTGDE